jgi:hypothetical protein
MVHICRIIIITSITIYLQRFRRPRITTRLHNCLVKALFTHRVHTWYVSSNLTIWYVSFNQVLNVTDIMGGRTKIQSKETEILQTWDFWVISWTPFAMSQCPVLLIFAKGDLVFSQALSTHSMHTGYILDIYLVISIFDLCLLIRI